jgi:ribosomal protein S18 acetylase RimI-like enzyme
MPNNLNFKTNDISTLDDVLKLSHKIFLPSKEDIKKYHNKQDWLYKINNNGLLISVYDDNNCIAFAICYKKDNKKLHIWNVGVLTKYRGQGVWRDMYNIIIEYAKSNGYKEITLNTYKEKFPNMYSFVKKEGFTLLKEETKDDGYIRSSFGKLI